MFIFWMNVICSFVDNKLVLKRTEAVDLRDCLWERDVRDAILTQSMATDKSVVTKLLSSMFLPLRVQLNRFDFNHNLALSRLSFIIFLEQSNGNHSIKLDSISKWERLIAGGSFSHKFASKNHQMGAMCKCVEWCAGWLSVLSKLYYLLKWHQTMEETTVLAMWNEYRKCSGQCYQHPAHYWPGISIYRKEIEKT